MNFCWRNSSSFLTRWRRRGRSSLVREAISTMFRGRRGNWKLNFSLRVNGHFMIPRARDFLLHFFFKCNLLSALTIERERPRERDVQNLWQCHFWWMCSCSCNFKRHHRMEQFKEKEKFLYFYMMMRVLLIFVHLDCMLKTSQWRSISKTSVFYRFLFIEHFSSHICVTKSEHRCLSFLNIRGRSDTRNIHNSCSLYRYFHPSDHDENDDEIPSQSHFERERERLFRCDKTIKKHKILCYFCFRCSCFMLRQGFSLNFFFLFSHFEFISWVVVLFGSNACDVENCNRSEVKESWMVHRFCDIYNC